MWLKQNTASQEILLGPFLDDTDGKTAETGLTIANTDIQLFKDGSTAEVNKNSGGATHISNGRYYAVLDATDTNTLGKLEVNVFVSGALPVRREFIVLPANAYDSLVSGTDYLQADAMQIEGADATDQINAACDVAINDASLATSAALATAQSAISALNDFDPAADTVANVSAVASVSGSVGSISGVTFPTNFSDLAIAATTGRVTVGTNADKTGYSLSQTFPTNFADLSISATTGRVDVGSMAADTITASAISADAVTELQNGVATSAALASAAAEISAILADTGTDGVVISSATANAIADAILSRNVSNTEATAAEHTLTTIVLAILESARTTTDWNIYRTNGSTVHAAKSISTDSAALPVVGVS